MRGAKQTTRKQIEKKRESDGEMCWHTFDFNFWKPHVPHDVVFYTIHLWCWDDVKKKKKSNNMRSCRPPEQSCMCCVVKVERVKIAASSSRESNRVFNFTSLLLPNQISLIASPNFYDVNHGDGDRLDKILLPDQKIRKKGKTRVSFIHSIECASRAPSDTGNQQPAGISCLQSFFRKELSFYSWIQ